MSLPIFASQVHVSGSPIVFYPNLTGAGSVSVILAGLNTVIISGANSTGAAGTGISQSQLNALSGYVEGVFLHRTGNESVSGTKTLLNSTAVVGGFDFGTYVMATGIARAADGVLYTGLFFSGKNDAHASTIFAPNGATLLDQIGSGVGIGASANQPFSVAYLGNTAITRDLIGATIDTGVFRREIILGYATGGVFGVNGVGYVTTAYENVAFTPLLLGPSGQSVGIGGAFIPLSTLHVNGDIRTNGLFLSGATSLTDLFYARTNPSGYATGLSGLNSVPVNTFIGRISSGTGQFEVLNTRQTKGILNMPWSPKDFGAIGNGLVDDSTAIQAAINALTISGGAVDMGQARYRISSNITVHKGVGLQGGLAYPDPRDATIFTGLSSTLLLDSGVTLFMEETSSIQGLCILKYGMTFPQNASGVATWTDTAITVKTGAHAAYIAHCSINGFNRAIDGQTGDFTEQTRVQNTVIDCHNGVRVFCGTDLVEIDNVECWPTTTVTVSGLTVNDLKRSGIGFELNALAGGIDSPRLLNCFTYGYNTGFALFSIDGCTLFNCVADFTKDTTSLQKGFVIAGDSNHTALIACKTYRQYRSIEISVNNAEESVAIVGCDFEYSSGQGIYMTNGISKINTCTFRGAFGDFSGDSSNFFGDAIVLYNAPSGSYASVDGCYFDLTLSAALVSGSTAPSSIRFGKTNMFGINGANTVYLGIASGVAQSSFLFPWSVDYLLMTGPTPINVIASQPQFFGQELTLDWQSSGNMVNSVGLQLAGGIDFAATPNDTITLRFNGRAWKETARTII